jgi:hypothetical protein
VRAVVPICLALLALLFVVAIGLSVVLPRTCGEDVVRVRPSASAFSASVR